MPVLDALTKPTLKGICCGVLSFASCFCYPNPKFNAMAWPPTKHLVEALR